jgi:hypothetical protein
VAQYTDMSHSRTKAHDDVIMVWPGPLMPKMAGHQAPELAVSHQ